MNIELVYPKLDPFKNTELEKLSKGVIEMTLQKLKYQLMWVLRNLEDEIEKEDGKIVFGVDGIHSITGFSSDLSEKILHLCEEGREIFEFKI